MKIKKEWIIIFWKRRAPPFEEFNFTNIARIKKRHEKRFSLRIQIKWGITNKEECSLGADNVREGIAIENNKTHPCRLIALIIRKNSIQHWIRSFARFIWNTISGFVDLLLLEKLGFAYPRNLVHECRNWE